MFHSAGVEIGARASARCNVRNEVVLEMSATFVSEIEAARTSRPAICNREEIIRD
jgi:hypothetical protein